jgi:2-furoyl-CoA dehydrogenase large subunit
LQTTRESPFTNQRIGTSKLRTEDLSLLTGTGRYADDLPVSKGARAIAFVRSQHAHAQIVSIDVSQALQMDGVEAVITGEDVEKLTQAFIVGVKAPVYQYALAVEKVRYFGEPVCMVVAADRYIAEDAADAVEVDYKIMPPVVNTEAAMNSDSPVLHDKLESNIVHERRFVYGDPDRLFAEAKHSISMRINYPRNSCTPIECFHISASYNAAEDSYDVTANFQGPYTLHPVMARALGVPGNRFRLKTPPDSGGSFGVKQATFPYIVACGVAARLTGRPVRWHEDRLEHLAAATSATNRIIDIEAAVNENGKVEAMRLDQIEDCGAFLRAPEPATLYRMHGNLNGAYDIENIAVRNRVVLTNKTPTGLVRGFGGPQLYFAIERLMNKIAKTLDVDPIEIRKLNVVKREQMPYRTASGALLDSGDYLASIDRTVEEAGYTELIARREAARSEGRLYGIGCAALVEPSISNMGYIATLLTPEVRKKTGAKNGALATATVAFDPTGAITVNTSSVPQGQGHRTVLAQVVAEVFDIDMEQIVVSTDHDTVKDSWSIASGNYSSRFAGAVAGAAHLAATKLAEKIKLIAASQLDIDAEDIIFLKGTAASKKDPIIAMPLSRAAASVHWSPLSMPEEVGFGLRETAIWSMPELTETDAQDRINSSGAHGFIFDLCGLEIDRNTGAIRIDKYVTMHDAGRLLNPMLANGQILGGFAQGLGAALLEEFSYSQDGSFLNGTLADYLMPTACEVPDIQILHDESPSPFTPLGAKGLAEGNCMSTPVCIANAVADALSIETVELPLTRSKVASMIYKEERAASIPIHEMPVIPFGEGHALTGQGSTMVPASVEEVWALLMDENSLSRVIPGCHGLELTGVDEYRADMTIGVGPIKGRFVTTVALKDMDPPKSLKLVGGASGPLGESKGEGYVTLVDKDKETELSYQYAILISGKAASIGGRMLDGATRSFINLFFKQLVSQSNTRQGNGILSGILNAVFRLLGINK